MPYLLFLKSSKFWNRWLLQIVDGALWVNTSCWFSNYCQETFVVWVISPVTSITTGISNFSFLTFFFSSDDLSSVDKLCKLFEPTSELTKCQSWSGSKSFDTLIVILKEFFEKVNFEKNQQTTTKACKVLSSVFIYRNGYVSVMKETDSGLRNVETTTKLLP